MNILVTGGAGFIGSHLVDLLLDKGYKVSCVDNFYLGLMKNIQHRLRDKNFKFYELDVLDLKSLNKVFKKGGFDAIFHLVANSEIKQKKVDTKLDLKLNFLSTYNVLEAMRQNNVKSIVFASTSAIFGETDKPITEDLGPLAPISFYGASKLAAEAYISAYVNNFGLQAWIIRFPNVVGARATHGILYDLLHKLKRNDKVITVLGDGNQEKPYLHVKELIEAMVFILGKAKDDYNCFNLGSDSTIKISKIIDVLIEELNLKGKICIKYTGGDRGWAGDVPRYKYNLKKINKLGWKARLSSEDAIRLSIRELKQGYGF